MTIYRSWRRCAIWLGWGGTTHWLQVGRNVEEPEGLLLKWGELGVLLEGDLGTFDLGVILGERGEVGEQGVEAAGRIAVFRLLGIWLSEGLCRFGWTCGR